MSTRIQTIYLRARPDQSTVLDRTEADVHILSDVRTLSDVTKDSDSEQKLTHDQLGSLLSSAIDTTVVLKEKY